MMTPASVTRGEMTRNNKLKHMMVVAGEGKNRSEFDDISPNTRVLFVVALDSRSLSFSLVMDGISIIVSN